ncbi:MAG: MFS transporter [Deltaproteobacteria bacterium]|nr:MFS transporter [Deltaproteobacteria bacterium]
MTDAPLSRKSQMFLLSLLTGIFFFNVLLRVILAPLLPVIERELGLNHTVSGSFFMMIALGYATGLFGSGFVSAHLTHRRTIVIAAVAGGCAFFFIAASHSLWAIRLGLVFLGIATGLYLPSGMTTITAAIRSVHWGKAIAFHEFAPSFAFILAPLIVEGLLLLCRWQDILVLIGAVSIILGLVFLRLAPGGDFTGEAPTLDNIRLLIGKPAFWIMVVLFSLAVGSSMGIYSMMPIYLVAERGIDRELANMLVGLSRISLLVVGFAAGWISDRIGPKPTIAVALLFIGLMTILLGLLPGRWVLLMVFLQPMMTVSFFPAGFTILSRIVPPRARNLSVSLTMFVGYLIGAGFLPTILGIFGDKGAFGTAFILVGSLMILGVLLLPRLILTEGKEN